jgi:heme oxygenase
MLTDALKASTREQHRLLEASNPLPNSLPDYVAQLVAFYGFVKPWEERLATVLPESDPIRHGRTKSGWLEADLAFFGYDAARRRELPRTSTLPSTSSRAEILGAAYVLEGATLGGQVISRHLEETLGLRGGEGYSFFRSYGERVGSQWQEFRAELLRASSPADDPVIVEAARNTFALLHEWFSQRQPTP